MAESTRSGGANRLSGKQRQRLAKIRKSGRFKTGSRKVKAQLARRAGILAGPRGKAKAKFTVRAKSATPAARAKLLRKQLRGRTKRKVAARIRTIRKQGPARRRIIRPG